MYIFLSGDHENNESKHTQEYSKGGEKLGLSLWAPNLLQIETQFYIRWHTVVLVQDMAFWYISNSIHKDIFYHIGIT